MPPIPTARHHTVQRPLLQKVTLWVGTVVYAQLPTSKPPLTTMSALLLEWAATLGLAKPLESLERDLANGVVLGQALVAIGVAPAEALDSLVDKTSVRVIREQ